MAGAQNFARQLMDAPANLMTPSLFVDAVSTQLGEVPGMGRSQLEVIPRSVDLLWIQVFVYLLHSTERFCLNVQLLIVLNLSCYNFKF